MKEYRPLILRSNRFLGSALVNKGIITSDMLETANQALLEVIQSDNLRQASVLNILIYKMKAIQEADLIDKAMDELKVGVMNLQSYDCVKRVPVDADPDFCWATWTVPFDCEDKILSLASVYCLCEPAVKAWQDKYPGCQLLWHAASMEDVSRELLALEERRTAAAAAAAADGAAGAAKAG